MYLQIVVHTWPELLNGNFVVNGCYGKTEYPAKLNLMSFSRGETNKHDSVTGFSLFAATWPPWRSYFQNDWLYLKWTSKNRITIYYQKQWPADRQRYSTAYNSISDILRECNTRYVTWGSARSAVDPAFRLNQLNLTSKRMVKT